MNIQNPAHYPPQQAYSGYGNAMAQPGMQPSSYPNDFSQNQFQQPFPQTPQRSNQFAQQPGSQIPPHVYQQLQQQQQGFVRPQSRGSNGMTPGPQQRQSPSNVPGANQNSNQIPRTNIPQASVSASQIPSSMAMATQIQQAMSNPSLAQQVQIQNAAQQMNRPSTAQQAQSGNQNPNPNPNQGQNQDQNQSQSQQGGTPFSPQTATREKARVAVLLDINSRLLQEVITLQTQGKAGPVTQQPNASNQQSPTSPNSAVTDNPNSFSPTDATAQNKATGPPSKEYQECMRRLQANLSYLAAIADAKKRPDGKVPLYPAIISPPPHLKEVYDLYKKLAMLFPEASQSKTNQAIAYASAQHQGSQGSRQVGQQGTGMGMNTGSGTGFGNDQSGQVTNQNQV